MNDVNPKRDGEIDQATHVALFRYGCGYFLTSATGLSADGQISLALLCQVVDPVIFEVTR